MAANPVMFTAAGTLGFGVNYFSLVGPATASLRHSCVGAGVCGGVTASLACGGGRHCVTRVVGVGVTASLALWGWASHERNNGNDNEIQLEDMIHSSNRVEPTRRA
jgi:hypothetical protein